MIEAHNQTIATPSCLASYCLTFGAEGTGDTFTLDLTMNVQLIDAAKRGDIPAVDALRKSGVDIIGSRDEDGLTSILLACINGHACLLEYLLEHGADANDQEFYGGTCLLAAACYRHPECVRRLIEAGADTKYAYSGDNATVVYMTVYCFVKDVEKNDGIDFFQEGSVISTVELLLAAGAPGHVHVRQINGSADKTALSVLKNLRSTMSVGVRGKVKRERAGLIDLLKNHEDP